MAIKDDDKARDSSTGENVEKGAPSYTMGGRGGGGRTNWCGHYWKQYGGLLLKPPKKELLHDPAIPCLGAQTKSARARTHTRIHTQHGILFSLQQAGNAITVTTRMPLDLSFYLYSGHGFPWDSHVHLNDYSNILPYANDFQTYTPAVRLGSPRPPLQDVPNHRRVGSSGSRHGWVLSSPRRTLCTRPCGF